MIALKVAHVLLMLGILVWQGVWLWDAFAAPRSLLHDALPDLTADVAVSHYDVIWSIDGSIHSVWNFRLDPTDAQSLRGQCARPTTLSHVPIQKILIIDPDDPEGRQRAHESAQPRPAGCSLALKSFDKYEIRTAIALDADRLQLQYNAW